MSSEVSWIKYKKNTVRVKGDTSIHAVGVVLVRIAVYRNPEFFIENKLWEKNVSVKFPRLLNCFATQCPCQ